MTAEIHDDAAAYALGALDPEERIAFEEHLEHCQLCVAEVAQFSECLLLLAAGTSARPSPSLREKVLAAAAPLPVGIFATRSGELPWTNTPFPGVSVKSLYQHPLTQQLTQLVKLTPGAQYPRHYHSGDEQCLVLEGDLQIGSASYQSGDFTVAAAGSTHDLVSSFTGCTLLLVSSPDDRVLTA